MNRRGGVQHKVISHTFEDSSVSGHEEISDQIIAPMIFGDANTTGLAPVWNKLYRREVTGKQLFDEDRFHGEDWLFNLRVFNVAASVTFISDPLYYYVIHSGSLVGRFNSNALSQMESNDRIFRTEFPQFDYDGIRYAKCTVEAGRNYLISAFINISGLKNMLAINRKLNELEVYKNERRIYIENTALSYRLKANYRVVVCICKGKMKKLIKER